MGKVFNFRRLPKYKWIVLLGALLIPLVIYSTYNQYLASKKNLNNLPVQLDKVLTAAQLKQNLITQSYYMKGYMLYKDPEYLSNFREIAGISQRDIRELYEIVRPERKPLVQKIADLQAQYTETCEDEIIPLILRGDTTGAVERVNALNLSGQIEQGIACAEELEDMRTEDAKELLFSVVGITRQSLLQIFSFIECVRKV